MGKLFPPQGPRDKAELTSKRGHRFVEHIERYDHVFPKFTEQGIAVFAFDQRGWVPTALQQTRS